jgi:hypothetical protein
MDVSDSYGNKAKLPPHRRLPGLPGVLIEEVSLVGVISTEEICLAFLRVEGQGCYVVRVGDSLMDGIVLSISNKGIVFSTNMTSFESSSILFKPFIGENHQ